MYFSRSSPTPWVERTLLYPIVEQQYPAFLTHMARQERPLPGYVQWELEEHLRCGRLGHGLLGMRCGTRHAQHLLAFSCTRGAYRTALPHMLFLDALCIIGAMEWLAVSLGERPDHRQTDRADAHDR